jgi:hypothetical protein
MTSWYGTWRIWLPSPTGKPGRPSRSLNLEQALAVLDTAKGERRWPYVAVSMLGGIRTEEAQAPS